MAAKQTDQTGGHYKTTSTNEEKKRREHQLLMIDYKSYYLSGRTTWLIKTGTMKSYEYLQMQHIFYDCAFT